MSRRCRIVFMGTPPFAVSSLDRLHASPHEVVAVVTAPDKPAGRGKQLRQSAVKEYAVRENIPCLQPTWLRDPAFTDQLRELGADIFIIVAFRMLPEDVWSIPAMGSINLHASLLPDYRGAAPINHAVLNGDTETGLTTFRIDAQIDTGQILLQQRIPIGDDMSAGDLHDKMMTLGGDLLLRTIEGLEDGTIDPVPQNHIEEPPTGWRSAPKIFKDDCRIDWQRDALAIRNQVRGLSPYPGAFTMLCKAGETPFQMKVFRAETVSTGSVSEPGTIESDDRSGLTIICGQDAIRVLDLQVEGRRKMRTEEFLRGFNSIESYKAC